MKWYIPQAQQNHLRVEQYAPIIERCKIRICIILPEEEGFLRNVIQLFKFIVQKRQFLWEETIYRTDYL